MSELFEKIKSMKFMLSVTQKEITKLETIKSVSKLSREQEFQLDMAKGTYKMGVRALKDYGVDYE
jgi:hypothetical protein